MAVVVDTLTARPRHLEKAHRPDAPILRKPDWIRVKAPVSRGYSDTQKIVKENGLHTVCEEAGCPNIGECWDKKHATFMIMGDTCTRACAFCNVKTGLPGALDAHEPSTSPRRSPSSACITWSSRRSTATILPMAARSTSRRRSRAIRARTPTTTIEILTPDFLRKDGAIASGGRGEAGCLQPQPRNRTVEVSHRPPGRALLRPHCACCNR